MTMLVEVEELVKVMGFWEVGSKKDVLRVLPHIPSEFIYPISLEPLDYMFTLCSN